MLFDFNFMTWVAACILMKQMHTALLRNLHMIFYGTKRVGCICLAKCRIFFFSSLFVFDFQKMSSFQSRTSLLRILYVLSARTAECFLLLVQAGHGVLPSTKKACVFLFHKNLQRRNWMSYRHNSWSKNPSECKCILARGLSGLVFWWELLVHAALTQPHPDLDECL